jgi:hypothetical protein
MTKKQFRLLGFIICSGVVAWYVYFHNQFYTHLRTDNMEALTAFKSDHIKGFRGQQILVHKDFEESLARLETYAAAQEITLMVNQSYRKQGQKVSRAVVNPANRSNHLIGFAIDANISYQGVKYFAANLKRSKLDQLPEPISNFIKAVRKDKSLRWGGDFRKQDPVHFDVPINLTRPKTWEAYFKRCQKDVENASYVWEFWKL